MKRLIIIFIFILISLTPHLHGQQDTVISKIIEIGKNDNQVMRHLDYLCNRFGGRMTGSNAYDNSVDWIVSECQKWGLNVRLEEAGELTVGFNRGPWFGKMIQPTETALEFVTPAYTSGTKGVQKGKALIAPKNDEEFNKIKDKIKDAWILLAEENLGPARDADSVSSFTQKLIEAGALGTIQKSKAPLRVFDIRRNLDFDNLPVLPDIKLLDTQYDQITDLINKGEEVILQFDIRNHFRPGPVKYYNVIVWLEGSELPDEYVILCGHLDSYDHATGAVDNGSGSMPSLEALRMIAKSGAKPKRTIMAALWAAEERGLIGSWRFVNDHKDMLPKISVVINRDGGTNVISGLSIPQVMYDDFVKVTEPVLNLNPKYPFKLTSGGRFRKAGRGGTDTHPFIMNGVPAFGFRTEGTHRYGTIWHTALDTYDQLIPEYLEHSTVVTAIVAYKLADMDHLLPREDAFLPDGLYADLYTNKGRITCALDFEHTPLTTANFIGLAEGNIKNTAVEFEKPYYRNSIWHRVVPGHVIQAGIPDSKNGSEGPGYEIPNEIWPGLSHNKAGMIGMANAGANTNGSQFYITLGDRSYLDGIYPLFGYVLEGMDIVYKIEQGDTIRNVSITRIGDKANKFVVTDETFQQALNTAKEKTETEINNKAQKDAEFINTKWPDAAHAKSGAKFLILKEGQGSAFPDSTELRIIYRGTNLDGGNNFVSTAEDGKPDSDEDAAEFIYKIGASEINPAFDDAVRSMKAGEKRKLIVPFNTGYGNNVVYGKMIEGRKRFCIPPFTSIIYEIEILGEK